MATLQPFLERITSKLHSWTVKTLSYAGKIRLIASEVYGMVDSICAAFMWNNNTTSASGARVAWKDICKPKAEDGLGIREGSFWFDSWTVLGPLISVVGDGGPRALRIRKDAHIVDATTEGSWRLPPARTNEMVALQAAVSAVSPPVPSNGMDSYTWIQANETYGSSFSSKVTWDHIRLSSPEVFWHKVIWFKENIPRNTFMSWLALLRRIPTKDRLRRWA
ncbi:uncharacterized protein LOC106350039 [Brassica napus]|uniref:uncharacterized protein LOC106350039 n=1 Tax=Brassica napus TaxID=3708 RepID=UPI0006AA7354|nr:uncharacterized protein LOC106350039 [Brassica napus]